MPPLDSDPWDYWGGNGNSGPPCEIPAPWNLGRETLVPETSASGTPTPEFTGGTEGSRPPPGVLAPTNLGRDTSVF